MHKKILEHKLENLAIARYNMAIALNANDLERLEEFGNKEKELASAVKAMTTENLMQNLAAKCYPLSNKF